MFPDFAFGRNRAQYTQTACIDVDKTSTENNRVCACEYVFTQNTSDCAHVERTCRLWGK